MNKYQFEKKKQIPQVDHQGGHKVANRPGENKGNLGIKSA